MPKASSKEKRVRLSLATKLEIIEKLEKGENHTKLMEEYNIKKTQIYEIRKKKEELKKLKLQAEVCSVTGKSKMLSLKSQKKPKFEKLDQAVYKWYKQQRAEGLPVRGPELRSAAMRFAERLEVPDFSASDGWLSRFSRRHDVRKKRILGERCSADYKSVKPFVEKAQVMGGHTEHHVWLPVPDNAAAEPLQMEDISSMTESRTANVYDSRHKKGDPNDTSGLQRIPQIPPTQSDAMESASLCARKSSQDDGTMTASNTVSTPQTNKRLPKKMGSPEPPKKLLKVKTSKKTTSRLETAISKLHEIIEMTNADAEDQYSSFGNHVASQLRELPLTSFIVLQEKIQSLITQERLATIQTPHPSLSPHSYHFVKEEITVEDSFNMKVEV
ncbi:jerky protein-like isoform X1 [Oratosquilla oratoria]|uniref:jerky protein-like isoform X1 n=1 Tax=Oratosquilla oratoria TaxID=337810 RepID=UPI003F75FBBE